MFSIIFKLTRRLALCLNILKLHYIMTIRGVPHQISFKSKKRISPVRPKSRNR